MRIFVLVNGRTRCVCGVFSSREEASNWAKWMNIDSWHLIERELDAAPVQYA